MTNERIFRVCDEPVTRPRRADHPGRDLPEWRKRECFRVVLLLDMAHLNPAISEAAAEALEPVGDAEAWEGEIPQDTAELLRRAAAQAAAAGIDSDDFMQAAWAACLDARPGLREELEDKELRSQLKKLRKRGLIGRA